MAKNSIIPCTIKRETSLMKKLIGISGIAVAVMLVLALMPHVGFGQSEVDPTVDRVGFPEGYQENFSIFYEFDRTQNGSARVIYANEAAAAVQADQPFFPYGSVLVMDVYRTQKDDDGNVVLDKNGNYVKDELFGLFVMRKERDFGTKYGEQRNGEWEYAAYRPDGSVLTPPERTLACAACHVEASEGKDWVFGVDRHFGTETAPEPGEDEIIVADYKFMPDTLTVKVGSEVTWTSSDVVFHAITASDGSFSGALRPNQSFTQKFEQPGTYEYFSAFYPNVKGEIEVVE
jgi:plastocyanin